jgi:pimeloyl-ACP methyl ester carboxylesterase
LFAHEFAGDITSWEPQVSFFARRYRVITYCHRGYPPSGVPEDPEAYSQERLVADMRQLLEHLGIGQAYIAGLSMGAATALSFAIAHPEMCRGAIVAATGTGSTDREMHLEAWRHNVERLKIEGIAGFADEYANGPTRVQFKRKDPVGWEKFYAGLASHSALGSALITQGIQLKRPTVFQLEQQMRRMAVPTLLLAGDEDDPCIEPMLFIKRCVATSGLVFFPQSGHTINLEEPALFNRTVLDFLTAVEAGAWATREG